MTGSKVATIDSLAFGGNGVCRIDGKVCFVPFSCPGDILRLTITSEKRSFQTARILEILEPSPLRVSPPCPIFGRCGGCSWQHIEYDHQLQAKQQILAEALWRGARVEAACVKSVLPSPARYGYRSRVQFKLHATADLVRIGFFRNNTHTVEDATGGCPVALPAVNGALASLRSVLRTFPDISAVPEISINCAENGCVAVVSFRGGDSAAAGAFFLHNRGELNPLTGLFLETGRKGELVKVYGSGSLNYSLPTVIPAGGTCRLAYLPGGFSQVNTLQNLTMLDVVRRMCSFQGTESLLDLYCGNGNFSLPLAGEVASIVGVEENDGSVASATSSMLANGIGNAEFICADAVSKVRQLAATGRRFDTIIIDPPRAGAADASRELSRLKPVRIVYVSCDPSTLARDCGILAGDGYRVVESVPLDMFPQTFHLESVTLLEK